ncbi:MAG: biotin--[acetyl-CoA-carboxylase] ligase [SAR324 cluster bacterium]|nr:biotin--[acetyl-CoA-carboxylase] ligase [SAR324 cluster bacterium]
MSVESRPIGHHVVRLEEVESTNTLVLQNPDYLEHHGLVVLARHQTGGRGRMGRRWASLPGQQLQFTVVLHPILPPEDFSIFSLLGGVAVAQAVEERVGLSPRLKWPNDVMVDGGKVCGILLESRPGPAGAPRLAMGIGLNCLGSPEDFPEEIRPLVNTLSNAAGKPVEMEPLFEHILNTLEYWHGQVTAGDTRALIEAWTARGLLRGQRVRVDTEEGMRECSPLGLTAEGYLLVEGDNGERFVQISGDLEWLEAES